MLNDKNNITCYNVCQQVLVTKSDKQNGGVVMRATKAGKNTDQKMLVDTTGLQEMLCAGRPSAVRIGTDAGARVQSGRRVFWNVKKIQQYLDAISE